MSTSGVQPASADPLTSLLAPAAKRLTCSRPDDELPEKSPELNPGHILAGRSEVGDALRQPSVQTMVPPPTTSAQNPSNEVEKSQESQHEQEASTASKGLNGRQSSIEIRTYQFKEVLRKTCVDLHSLRNLAVNGIPDQEALRATAWKLLLNYLPPERKLWSQILHEKREAYDKFCKELIVDPKEASMAAKDDHPLSQNHDSRWAAFFKDAEMMEQIDRDVMRTHPDMHFFSGSDSKAQTHRSVQMQMPKAGASYVQEMKRILFIFAKLNPGLRYVQGMNEILAPLYYQFRNDLSPDGAAHAEADSFYCFMDIISEFRDHFCQQLDNSKVGIRATLSKLSDLLHEKDPQLWQHVQVANKVNPQFYAFRWITLLLTQEFPFPDSVRLWDTLFSERSGRYDCLLRFCCAMLVNIREELLRGDFSQNLKLLQRYPPVDVHAILHRAASM